MKPYLFLAALLFGTVPTFSQSCDIKTLMARHDVRRAMNILRDETKFDGHEHGLIVLPTAEFQKSAGASEIKLQVPPDAVAFFHTHPLTGYNQPSNADVVGFLAIRKVFPTVCSYVLGPENSAWTVWEITPLGGAHWVSFF